MLLVSAPLSLTGLGFIGLTIVGICELVDAFRIPGIACDYNNRLIARLPVWATRGSTRGAAGARLPRLFWVCGSRTA